MLPARVILIVILVIIPVFGQPYIITESQPMSELIIEEFQDANLNGHQDTGDSGVSGWSFDIIGSDGHRIITANESGVARIILPPGLYRVRDAATSEWAKESCEIMVSLAPNTEQRIAFANYKVIESLNIKQNELNYRVYPQITFIPESLNFTESENEQRIDMTVYCPNYCNIYEAKIKLQIPKGWTVIPNSKSSQIYYSTKYNNFFYL
jgi:hypothetical protein